MSTEKAKINPDQQVVVTKLAEMLPSVVEVGHWVKGEIMERHTTIGKCVPTVGEVLWVKGAESSDSPSGERSIFNTSKIEQIIPTVHGLALVTRNSVWLLENC